MIISTIVAMNPKRIIGHLNQIPWYLSEDLKYFKKVTTGHHVIMGRKCFESIGKPLPNRTNIIITRDPYYIVSNAIIAHSVEEAIVIARENKEEEAFIIGGGEIYNLSARYWDKMYITEVNIECEGDIFFPEVDMIDWRLISSSDHISKDERKTPFTFKLYER